jgi:predicted PhzF superfamily epimerase YddE/YHI9
MRHPHAIRTAGLIAALTLAFALPAWAGGSGFGEDEEDQELAGHPYVGFVRDQSGDGIADAKITVEVKAGTVVLRSDEDGHFVLRGLGANVDPETVKVTCVKDGYKLIAASKQAASDQPTAPVEVNCIMAKQ